MLTGNNVKEYAVLAMGDALESNTTLTVLNLGCSEKRTLLELDYAIDKCDDMNRERRIQIQ